MIFLFNGPPGSGKDFAANSLEVSFGATHVTFKEQLIIETVKHFDCDFDEFCRRASDRVLKETSWDALGGLTPRQALIETSENNIKPKYGDAYFGVRLADRIAELKEAGEEHFVVSDSGFVGEAQALIERFGDDEIVLVRIQRDGCTFDGDSRKYLRTKEDLVTTFVIGNDTFIDAGQYHDEPIGVMSYLIHNNGSLEGFGAALASIYHGEVN